MPEDVPATSMRERGENPTQRADRNFGEVLQELRVAQAAVQILFGFLLALAFTGRFPANNRPFVWTLTAALLLAGAAAVAFITPVLLHRGWFGSGRKAALVWVAHWCAIAGMLLLMGSMLLAVWLVLAFLWSQAAATLGAAVLAVVATVGWALLWTFLRRSPGRPPGG